MSAEKIIADWKKGNFKPIYWLEGDEPFFIDQVVNYAEHKILSESEASFNLSIFYGKDADWSSVVNACMRYPMFADKQVVILKEAQQMRDIEKLESYIDNPLASTIFVVSFKEKPKGDGVFVNGGFFVLSPKVLSHLQDDSTVWEQEPLMQLAADGQLMAYQHHGFWQPMDTLHDKMTLENLWASGQAPWKKWD
jgi:hypothetical protein